MMNLTQTLFFTSSIFIPTLSFAAGAQDFKDLKSLKSQSFYRVACSDQNPNRKIDAHVFVTINNGKVEEVRVVALAPALSLKVYEYGRKEANSLSLKLDEDGLRIHGDIPGPYWPETLHLEVKDTADGMRGQLVYNDGDSGRLDRDGMTCGANNYQLAPIN